MHKYFTYTDDELLEHFGTTDITLPEIASLKKSLFKQYDTLVIIELTSDNKKTIRALKQKHGNFEILCKLHSLAKQIWIKTKSPELMTIIILEAGFTPITETKITIDYLSSLGTM